MLKIPRNGVRGVITCSICLFRGFLQYTTSANKARRSSFMVDYLVNSLGFSKETAILASNKPKVSGFISAENPNSVVEFLKTSGFDDSHIKNAVCSYPSILSCDVDKTLKPKLKVFQDLGLSGSDLADVISSYPDIFERSVNAHIVPTLEALKSVFGELDGNPIMLRALKKSPWMLASGVAKHLPANVSLLQNYGLSTDKIKVLLLRIPRSFSWDSKWFEAVLIRVEQKLGIPCHSSMFFHGICAVASMTEENLELKMELYKSFGWTESDVLTLARKCPNALSCSESKIRSRLEFFMRVLGYKPAEIARRGCIMTYSLEKRVIPRNEVLKILKENGLIKNNYCLFSCLNAGEAVFLKRFVLPFKDKVPGLYDDYMKRVSSFLEAAKWTTELSRLNKNI